MANMFEYQKFMDVFHSLKREGATPLMKSFPLGIKSKPDFGKWFDDYSKGLFWKMQFDLQRAKFFEIDDRTKRAMLLTNSPKDNEFLRTMRLPYPAIFLDINITDDDADIGEGKEINGILISEVEVKANDFMFMVFFSMTKIADGKIEAGIEHFKLSWTDIADNLGYASGTGKIRKTLEQLVVNTILFIDEPEVEWIQRPRSKRNIERKIREGKMPLPDSQVVRLTGRLKKYFDEFGSSFDGNGYSYRFDVRGTWRHFRSERYKRIKSLSSEELEKQGYRVKDGWISRWIPPFKKGDGVYIKKTYSLEKPKENGVLEFDDIEPLKRPLAKMK